TQLSEMVNKTVKYESAPQTGDWMNRMLLAGGISNYPEPEEGDYDGEDEARLTQYLWQNYIQEEMNFTHLHRTTNYFDPIPSEGEASLTQSNFRNEINNGYSAVFFFLFIFPLFIPVFNLYKNNVNHLKYSENISISSDISDIDLSIISEINYTALNTSWYEPKIEMLIIIPNDGAFYDACVPLMEWKNEKGLKTVIKNASSYSGTGAGQVKNLILDYYENENLQWVLIAGDTDIIPIKSVDDPNLGNEPTDFFYADLNSNWSDPTSVDWTAEVYVGRLPADTSTQLSEMVNKTVKY
ncbi:unnamed protein product, partial [marine sediment metagenome]